MSNEERVVEASEAEESSVHAELARIDQTDAVVRLVEAGQISCLDPSRYVAIPVPEDMTPTLSVGLAGAGTAAELFAAWGKSNLALVLNGSIDDLRAVKGGLGLIPRFLGPDGKVTALARLQKVQLDSAELSAAALQVAAAYVQAQYMEDIGADSVTAGSIPASTLPSLGTGGRVYTSRASHGQTFPPPRPWRAPHEPCGGVARRGMACAPPSRLRLHETCTWGGGGSRPRSSPARPPASSCSCSRR